MIDHIGPCAPTSQAMHAFIVVMNVMQSVLLALVAQRAVRKNRDDRRANGCKSD
jgi:hypothetical protein